LSAPTLRLGLSFTHRVLQTYLAISIAPALHGVVQIMEGAAGLPGCIVELPAPACRSAGERIGDENERR